MKVIAKHRIEGLRFAPRIEPGTTFDCPAELYEHLKGNDAIEDYKAPVEAAIVPEPAVPAKKAARKTSEDGL